MFSTPLHPILVHFPIALISMGIVTQFLIFWKKDFFDKATFLLLSTGFVMGIFSYIAGDGAKDYAEKTWGKGIEVNLEPHETYALITLIIIGAVLALKVFNHYKKLSFVLPLILVLCIAGGTTLTLTGHYGGKIVYQQDPINEQVNDVGD
ncbi:MAG: hypothetical protein N2C11_08275 [Planococcus sp. (in: firmicutes)]|uniref:DUF2231 domain-containing protein n=1 Tax=Planococcus halocryophilus TaxID=1215089 RepID=UPI001F10BBF7|nr:DUF2231 domain-containing protein [Planococcus halocryophilus]MCH4825351.1 hypothetical protein [Planococcus halocryophilus]